MKKGVTKKRVSEVTPPNVLPYIAKNLLDKAMYILNQVDIGFLAEERRLTKTFTRVSPNDLTDIVRVPLPEYLHRDTKRFIEEYSKLKKAIEK